MADAAAFCSSSAAVSPKKYDVFISFRGEDTRSNFTSHLHEALCRNQIETYIDYRLEKGDEVWPSLVEAIQDSTLFLIIFSENYASSTWCLNELTKILECSKDHKEHLVIPVFYRTDPSHVRKQTGSYEIAFTKHEHTNHKQQLQQWKDALTQAANLSGWHCDAERNEAELIGEIVKCVLMKLDHSYTSDSNGLVGIHERITDVESLLFKGSQDVRFIGIWGMGGIGKTTLAAALFNKLCFAYEGFCFLANVKEESKKYGMTYLKNKLLSTLLDDKGSHNGMPDGGTPYAMRRLSRKKVLVVFDDVNDSEQLEKLAGAHTWFGPGSRVIITTRDKQVIITEVDDIYEVEVLNFDEALQLFYLNAFKSNCPDMEFRRLSQRVVDYAKGIPLALKVLASLLYGKGKNEWESQLEKLKKISCTKIQDVLRLSYDELDHEEKSIFLDVACFFKGRGVEHIKILLDACGYSTTIGLQSLKDKSLLTISKEEVSMHDLIQEMGWEIVREESIEDPEKRSRLWDANDIYQVLKNDTGTEAIKGITLDVSKIEELYLSPLVFARMPKLKFLQIYSSISEEQSLHLPKGLKSLPNELRYLHWDGYPLQSLPSTFSAEKLVTLEMRNSQVRKLWHGTQNLVNLKEIDLNESENLIELPDFSKALRLEKVYLEKCTSLRNVHPSIFSLGRLEVLELNWCESITSLRSDVHLTSLCRLSLYDCSRLKDFSLVSENMRSLNLAGTAINGLPSNMGLLSKLETFNLHRCKSLKILPNKLADLKSLRELHIHGCTQLATSNLRFIFDGLQSLEVLWLDNCCNLFELPDNISLLSSLTTLSMRKTAVQSLPASIKHLSRLKYLSLEKCRRLQSLPELPPSIGELYASNCTSLEILQFTAAAAQLLKVTKIRIHFQNCLKLHEYSLNTIRANALLEINRAVSSEEKSDYIEIMAEVRYPGSRVPEWFMYSTTKASITIDLSSASHSMDWGFIFCVIVPPGLSKESIFIDCEGYEGDDYADEDEPEDEEFFSRSSQGARNLTSDHVFLWYDQRFCSKIHEIIQESTIDDEHTTYKSKISFKFKVYYTLMDSDDVDRCEWDSLDYEEFQRVYMEIRECGVCPTYTSEYQNFIKQMELVLESQVNATEVGVGSSHEDKDEKETLPQKSKEFIFPTLPTGTWKNGTKGLKDIIFL